MTQRALAERFRELNGDHPMTAEDDAYVTRQFRVLAELCADQGRDCDEVRKLMLDHRLPLPGYLRSDGAEMVPADLFRLADEAGGVDRLEDWFVAHWTDVAEGRDEWEAYLSGQYVCLHSVTPATIHRKAELMQAIETTADTARLTELVDELDRLEPEFTAYDRLRFGGPASRDTHITAVRERMNAIAEQT
ncbi:MAG TPA: DUF6058 family natural product biosynthesis protein [Kribbella sp.]|nr:DUF6058 family natural product biosynthesis protein [Kribbella sp.]